MSRRFVITIGVGSYRDSGIPDLPGARVDADRVRELFERMGYVVALPELASVEAHEVPVRISNWAAEMHLTSADIVVVYFAGHGAKNVERHHLLWPKSVPGRSATALASEDLARPLMSNESDLGHLLVMLDTCYGAAGSGDVAKLAAELTKSRRAAAGCWTLAAARGKEMAQENAFVDAFVHALDLLRSDTTAEFIPIDKITGHVNGYFAEHRKPQCATHSIVESKGGEPFFPNPDHIPGPRPNGISRARLDELRKHNRAHFDPAGRGVRSVVDQGDYFTCRTAVLRELASWLRAGSHDRKARVVTGEPGSGKSAVLGRLLLLTDASHPVSQTAEPELQGLTEIPVVPLHARRATLETLVRQLAVVLDQPKAERDELLDVLRQRTTPIAVIVDALDEAGPIGDTTEAATIARDLLAPLTTLPALRLIIGTRRPQLSNLGHAVRLLDLDDPGYITDEDIAIYARNVLLDEQDPASLSPYRRQGELAKAVGDAIAARARGSFLVARVTATALVHGQVPIDTTKPGWQKRLPSDLSAAYDQDLARFGPDRQKVERLLRPLAYAEGVGLPRSALWTQLAEALSEVRCANEDLHWLHTHASAYIVANEAESGPAYLLFHETMADYLRFPDQDIESQQAITATLLDRVPASAATGRRDWAAAHPYIRDHLATHAAAGRMLDPLVADSDFLVHATPDELLLALHSLTSGEACRTRTFYRASAAKHRTLDPLRRSQVLAMDAARIGADHQRQALSETLEWRPRWATGEQVSPALHSTLAGHERAVTAVACSTVDDRPVAVTVSTDETVRIWDLATGTVCATLSGHDGAVTAIACTVIAGRPVGVTGGVDTTLRVWDLASETLRATYRGHSEQVQAVACTTLDGRPVAVSGGQDGTVRVWDLITGAHSVLARVEGSVTALGTIDGLPMVVVASTDRVVRVWDLADKTCRVVLSGQEQVVMALACGMVKGSPAVVIAGDDVTVWDLARGIRRNVFAGHESWVNAVSCTVVNGQSTVVTATDNGVVRVWDSIGSRLRTELAGHHSWINAVACTETNGRPVAVTAGNDGMARVWDLSVAVNERRGHTGDIRAIAGGRVDGRAVIVSAGEDHVPRIWDLASGDMRGTLVGHTDLVNSVACIEVDGHPRVVTASVDSTVRVWDLATRELVHTLTGHGGVVHALLCTSLAGRAIAITAGKDRAVWVWDLASGRLVRALVCDDTVYAVSACVIADEPQVFVSDSHGSVLMWNLMTERRMRLTGHDAAVSAVDCATVDGQPVVITASRDRTVRTWQLATGAPRAILPGHDAAITDVDHSSVDGRPVAVTTSRDGTARIWDLTDNTHRATFNGHTGPVLAVTCTTIDGQPAAITTGADQTVRIWNMATTHELAVFDFPAHIGAVLHTNAAEHLVVATSWDLITLERRPGPVHRRPAPADASKL